jgi:hypothetical protein
LSLPLQRTALLLVALGLPLACAKPPDPEFDRAALERREDLSEALANDLLKLSIAVRDRDYAAAERFFSDSVRATPWPRETSETVAVVRWVQRHDWALSAAAKRSGEQFVKELRDFLGRFGEIEDARFKVRTAEFDDGATDRGSAAIKFFVIGRDQAGRREWLRGKARIEAGRNGDEPWRIGVFELESLESLVSTEDLFSEVAFPAGVSALFPPFGEGQNAGFVSHGAAAADVDGDGLLDLAATGVERNYLYLNRGDGTFADVSEESLVGLAPRGSGALFFDFDNDGDQDLFFAAVGRQILLENRQIPDGELRFWDISEKAGVDRPAVGFSVVAADVNADGFTDVYVCSYNRYGTVMPNSWHRATNGTPNLLFLNQGDGTFRESASQWGVADSRWSYAAGFVDIDEDGDQDLYVANDFGENAFYRNDGDRFVDVAESLGLKDPGFGMGVSFGDYDNDGDLDLHVTNMSSTAGQRILKSLYPEGHEIRETLYKQAAGNSLYENTGGARFRSVTEEVGGLAGGWAFGGGFVDFDNDGWQDLYTPNGFVSGKTMDDT